MVGKDLDVSHISFATLRKVRDDSSSEAGIDGQAEEAGRLLVLESSAVQDR